MRPRDPAGRFKRGWYVRAKRDSQTFLGWLIGRLRQLAYVRVWMGLPRCAAVIASRRSEELGNAIRAAHAAGAMCYLLTLTMRHSSRDELSDLWSGLSAAWRKTFGATAWTGDKGYVRKDGSFRPPRLGDAGRFGVAGLCRVVEVTHGLNGWHLHAHVLVVTTDDLGLGLRDDYDVVLRRKLDYSNATVEAPVGREWLARTAFSRTVWKRWAEGLRKAGLEAPTSVGVDLRLISDGEDVVGRYLVKATYDAAKNAGAEIAAGSVTKEGKAEGRQETHN